MSRFQYTHIFNYYVEVTGTFENFRKHSRKLFCHFLYGKVYI